MIYLLALESRDFMLYCRARDLRPGRDVKAIRRIEELRVIHPNLDSGDRVIQLERFWKCPDYDAISEELTRRGVPPDSIEFDTIWPKTRNQKELQHGN